MKIGLSEVWKNTRKIAFLVFLDLETELCLGQKYFCHENENEKNYLNPQFALFWNTMGLILESIVSWIKIEKTDFFMFSLYFWLGPLYISKAIAPSSSFSFEKFTHYYQIGALQRQWALGRAR